MKAFLPIGLQKIQNVDITLEWGSEEAHSNSWETFYFRLYFSESKEKKTMRDERAHANVNGNLGMITVINGKRLSHHCC